jgi:perosamine synthetase
MLRELPPTAGLAPRLSDLLGRPPVPFDEAVARFLDTPAVTITSSGTAALVIAFETLKTLSPRRTVIVPGYTCPLVVMAAAKAGLKVRACDILPDRFEMDPDQLGRLIDADTLAVLPTHWGGALADVAGIRRLVEAISPDIHVIEDAAQAFGARRDGRPVGFAGPIGMFSFAAGKGLSLYEGGCLVSPDPAMRARLAAMALRLEPPNTAQEARRAAELLLYHLLYRPFGLVFAYGLPRRHWIRKGDMIRALGDDFAPIALHAVGRWRQAVGARALPRLAAHLDESRARFDRLAARLPRDWVHPPRPGEAPSATFLFVTLPEARQADQLLKDTARTGLGLSRLFAHAITDYPALSGLIEPAALPAARDLAARTVTLSTSGYLSRADEDRVIAACEALESR